MSAGRSFDRAADVYDQTRRLAKPMATAGIQAILDAAGPGARILEVGAGTGRIGGPLLERGARVVGIDLSARMLGRFREKFPRARLAQADATQLPFGPERFDAVLSVHTMHLILRWREALGEFRRVLRPGGAYLNASTWEPVGTSVKDDIRRTWRASVASRGIDARAPGVQSRRELQAALEAMGARVSRVEGIRAVHAYTLAEEIERYETRVYSYTWDVPEAVHAASVRELRDWVTGRWGALDQRREEAIQFTLDVARFESRPPGGSPPAG